MRAAHYSGPGSASDVIAIVDTEAPTPGPTDVLLDVATVGLNPVDVKIRAAAHDFQVITYSPFPGWDVAGTIAAVGSDVTGWHVGDRVFALAAFPAAAHTLAEQAVVAANDLAPAPSSWSSAQAGAAPLAALTAAQMLERTGVTAGQRVLVLGGAGGVGHFAIQLAKARGAEVIATASPAKASLVTSWGADEVVDYRDADALESIGRVDAVIVTVDATLPPRSSLDVGTRVITITGFTPEQTDTLKEWGAASVDRHLVTADGPTLAEIAHLADEGRLTVHVDSSYALDDLVAAQERVESGRVTGKVVVIVTPEL